MYVIVKVHLHVLVDQYSFYIQVVELDQILKMCVNLNADNQF